MTVAIMAAVSLAAGASLQTGKHLLANSRSEGPTQSAERESTASAFPNQRPGSPRWEYARLGTFENDTRLGFTRTDQRWLTADTRVRASSWDELIVRLGGASPDEKDDISPVSILLNMIGAQGWELVSHTAVPIPKGNDWQGFSQQEVWTFKRQQ